MMELDTICRMATPKQSIVLAMDGPPAAAKVATQRRRRYSTLVKNELKMKRLHRFQRRFTKAQFAKKIRMYKAEVKTLSITPGTEFMERTEQALLYWAWQRLSRHPQQLMEARKRNKNGQQPGSSPVLASPQVKVYISCSSVPGEGEIKLLEWILQHPQKLNGSASIAILGGDSDLVLEALTIPPKWTHNVFVLLPEGSQHYISVSAWETTRSMASQLFSDHESRFQTRDSNRNGLESTQQHRQEAFSQIKQQLLVQARNDFVLLVIFNGNDYLPRLRGSSGFNRVYRTYINFMKKRYEEIIEGSDDNGMSKQQLLPGLVNIDRLEFRLEFCIDFFQQLSRFAPPRSLLDRDESASIYDESTPEAQLRNLVDSGFLPQPMKWQVTGSLNAATFRENNGDGGNYEYTMSAKPVNGDTSSDSPSIMGSTEDEDYNEFDDDESIEDEAGEVDNSDGCDDDSSDYVLLRLKLGIEGSDDFFQYEMFHKRNTPLRPTKHKLAQVALNKILEEFSVDGGEDGGLEGILPTNEYDEVNEDADSDEDGENMITSSGYPWEVPCAVEANVEEYLAGLLWNLQTYQDGICADYGYNYGRRLAPTAQDIVEYFKQAQANNRTVGRQQLLGNFTHPVSAGISCLAALPSQVKHLVPEPYSWLPDSTVEDFYAKSMDPENNVFDFKRFERLCEAELEAISYKHQVDQDQQNGFLNSDEHDTPLHGRRIIMGDHFWTVLGRSQEPLAHPFDPPLPFSDRLSNLRPNNRIRITRLFAANKPRPRAVWGEAQNQSTQDLGKPQRHVRRRRDAIYDEVDHVAFGSLMDGAKSVMEVGYKIAYQDTLKRGSQKAKQRRAESKETESIAKKQKTQQLKTDISARMKQFQMEPPPKEIAVTKDGITAIACLRQLKDSGLIGEYNWTYTYPSKSTYASFLPDEYENVRLTVQLGENAESIPLPPNLVYEQDREHQVVSRKLLKHHLASMALRDITGPESRWCDLTFAQLKDHLVGYMSQRGSK